MAFKDLRRILSGVALVAGESLRRSPAVKAAISGDLDALLSTTVKNAVVSATDLAGLTKGRPRSPSPSPASAPAAAAKDSVVYFSNPPPADSDRIEEIAVAAEVPAGGGVEEETNSIELRDHNNAVGAPVQRGRPGGGGVEEETNLIELRENNNAVVAPVQRRRPRERRVPATPFGRALGFAGLGAGLAWGTVQEYSRRLVYGQEERQSALSPFLSEQNAERLALALCRMRGAALKLGQMLSIQDESLVPAPILRALEIVRQGADVMPRSQLNAVLDAELGYDWQSKLKSFDYDPLAAASIGQVHRAVMKDGLDVAVKIQYPGVADSIESDIENVRRLLDYTNLIPKGLFLDRAIKVAKEELSRECNYLLEASNQKRFRLLLSETQGFYVPMVIDEFSSRKVLTTELVSGIPIDKVALLSQETRDYVGTKLLEITLKELFIFRFMQTDPNWSNFLYDEATNMINLIDFGAAQEYPETFVDYYLRMVMACSNSDKDEVIEMSKRLGFLTGEESEVMLDAHVQAGFIVGLPFSKPGGYDFRANNITQSISNLGATMLRHRLTPPPDEAYSLHRKLSGAFLACIKLGAVVPCRDLLLEVYRQYQLIDDSPKTVASSA